MARDASGRGTGVGVDALKGLLALGPQVQDTIGRRHTRVNDLRGPGPRELQSTCEDKEVNWEERSLEMGGPFHSRYPGMFGSGRTGV